VRTQKKVCLCVFVCVLVCVRVCVCEGERDKQKERERERERESSEQSHREGVRTLAMTWIVPTIFPSARVQKCGWRYELTPSMAEMRRSESRRALCRWSGVRCSKMYEEFLISGITLATINTEMKIEHNESVKSCYV
jgi:hypothetical protein